jgi:hypothetical protein
MNHTEYSVLREAIIAFIAAAFARKIEDNHGTPG